MPTLGKDALQHAVSVAAPAQLVFDLVAGLQNWAQFHGPSIHAEPLGRRDDGTEEFRHWWVIDDRTVRTWRARWRFDRTSLRISYEFDPAEPAAAGQRGEWTFRELSAASTEVRVEQETLGDERDAALADRELRELLSCVTDAAERHEERQDLVVDFEDPLFVAGAIDDAYAYLYEADKWPERIPHVSRLVLEESVPHIQFFDMDTTTPDGSAHTTRSVRVCLPGDKIVYKQIHLPKLLTGHTGHWKFTPTREGFVLGARHTATIKPSALAILGEGTSVLDARKYLRRVLSANSMGNLRLSKAFAEERAGV
ncbi:SRPBCC family protein [Streptomyces sp. NPDC006332]|uniref:SRPBCC family protein n=1 Tax=Streptomyces sp. NPDC006332 TaxID=3155456 RepID=UPI0033ADAEAC